MIKPAIELVDDYKALYFIADYQALITVKNRKAVKSGYELGVFNKTKRREFRVSHTFTERQVEIILAGRIITVVRSRSD